MPELRSHVSEVETIVRQKGAFVFDREQPSDVAEISSTVGEMSNGSKWVGGKKENGDLHGACIVVGSNGNKFEGYYKNGQRNWKGRLIFGDAKFRNDCYIGEYFDSKFTGVGCYEWNDGDWYRGEWFDGKINGYGHKRFNASGNEYQGWFNYNTP
mmetsp:Transcript_22260/g.10674  ORF Transcript_22260/g.10674 Transcript_22260/m.10674 type:complete len:155 (+) Transcript_22260:1960-2424(+)